MKFTSEEELLDCIRTGVDLYSPSLELYMFLYNEAGAVCTYSGFRQKAHGFNRGMNAFFL